MAIEQCPFCGLNVIPMEGGKCPACCGTIQLKGLKGADAIRMPPDARNVGPPGIQGEPHSVDGIRAQGPGCPERMSTVSDSGERVSENTMQPNAPHEDGGKGETAKGRTVKRTWFPQVVLCAMLLWALNESNPYGYYILLRFACCGAFAWWAFRAASEKKLGWAWVFGAVGVVYNPVIRVHLTRDIWSVINVLSVGVAIASIAVLSPTPRGEKQLEQRRPSDGRGIA